MRRLGQAAAMMCIWALSLTTGCGNFWVYPGSKTTGTGTTGTGDYVYVANATTDNVAAFEVGTGSLTAISGSPFALGYSPTAAVVNPANSILFVSSSSGIYSYSISSTGALSSLSNPAGSPAISGLLDVVSLAVSPDGNWLFALEGVATANVVTICEFSINSSTGALSALNSSSQSYTGTYTITAPTSTVPAAPSQIAVASVASGEYVFATLGTGGTLIIPFNTSTGIQAPTGTKSAQIGPPSGSNFWTDDALAVNSSTSVLYVVSSNTNSSAGVITAFTLGSNGTNATQSTLATGATAFQPTAVVLNSAGTDIYVANTSSNSISGFNTTVSGGILPTLTGSPYSFGYAPTGLAVDHSGDYLLAIANAGGPDLTMYSYGSAGQLSQAASNATGTDPAGAFAIATTH